jgi:hypothetical protein
MQHHLKRHRREISAPQSDHQPHRLSIITVEYGDRLAERRND